MTENMSKGEREDLQRLIRQREKVLESAAKQRSGEILADFENQMAAEYRFDDDVVWEEAARLAEKEVAKAKAIVAQRCMELGIPKQFAPSLNLTWSHRGYSNSVKQRREELRTVAKAQIESLERKAIVGIRLASVEAQTQIAVAGLTSAAAREFLTSLPSVTALMPQLSYQEITGESETPPVEQLLTPNAIRQRRFREKQQALRDGTVTPELALRDGTSEGAPE